MIMSIDFYKKHKKLIWRIFLMMLIGPPAFFFIIYICIWIALISHTGRIDLPILVPSLRILFFKLSLLGAIGMVAHLIFYDIQERKKN
ncbi:MAG: hypothetical protein JWQ10_2666 [Herbaspirillum sp.]|nr:hypothetical protein [Herbaspirillum sp.]